MAFKKQIHSKILSIMRKNIIAGNWKMNTCLKSGQELANAICSYVSTEEMEFPKIILGVPFTHLYKIVNTVAFTKISVAAQNCSENESGAFTGEVSAEMIKSTGANMVIIGHSERRTIFNETDEIIAKKIKQCLKHLMCPIFCCGESKEEREQNQHYSVVESQIKKALFDLDEIDLGRVVIAYEPVWAIGTGLNATPGQAQEMHKFIRNIIAEKFTRTVAENISILYGGSVKPDNAKDLFKQPDIDGGLIGGASLVADDFIEIIKALNH